MNGDLCLPAPAKLNLFLHITGRRDDGYHNLQTLFQLLDYGDELTFHSNGSGKIQLQPAIAGVAMEDNLIYRAAQLLKPYAADSCGCDIYLHKQLPMGAGLGGGSSDAATTLVALNRLWDCQLGTAELAKLGCQLGADVPLFVEGNSAFAEGIGEQLTPVELQERWFLVVTPPCEVNTGEIFSNPQLTRDTSAIKIRALSTVQGKNDCQAVVEKLYPPVQQVLEWLNSRTNALMTGTGASVFAGFSSRTEAEQHYAQVPKKWKAFIARGVNRSPLYRQLP